MKTETISMVYFHFSNPILSIIKNTDGHRLAGIPSRIDHTQPNRVAYTATDTRLLGTGPQTPGAARITESNNSHRQGLLTNTTITLRTISMDVLSSAILNSPHKIASFKLEHHLLFIFKRKT